MDHPCPRGIQMVGRQWKLSQLISLTFVAAVFGFIMLGSFGGGQSTLMADIAVAIN